jgi:geranylgeranyl pyrophosphate synthase
MGLRHHQRNKGTVQLQPTAWSPLPHTQRTGKERLPEKHKKTPERTNTSSLQHHAHGQTSSASQPRIPETTNCKVGRIENMKKKGKTKSSQDPVEQIQQIFKKRGAKVLKKAEKTMLSEKIESKQVNDALSYFMKKYWLDTTRPALLSLFCEAVGGKAEATEPIAVSAILTSGAADIHDDIIDGSKVKEAGPTVYGKFGKEIALLAGDALLFKGLTLLFQTINQGIPVEKLSSIWNVTKETFFELGDAEALELEYFRRVDVTPDEYLHLLKKKAAIIGGYAQIGGILGDGSKEELENLVRYGEILGMLILLRDEVIDLIDINEIRHRIEKESLPLPVIYALQNPKTESAMMPILRKKKIILKEANLIVEMTRQKGGVERCMQLIQKLAEEAYTCLSRVRHNRAELELLVRAVAKI